MKLKKREYGDEAKFLDPASAHLHWACQSKGCKEEAFARVSFSSPTSKMLSLSRLLCQSHAESEMALLKRVTPEAKVTHQLRPDPNK